MKRYSAIIFIKEKETNKYLLFQHRNYFMKNGRNTLSFVQGAIEDKETSRRAAYREASEETSLDKFIEYSVFKKYAKKISSGTYNCYVFNITKIKELKQWTPFPQKKFSGEVNLRKWPTGHVWIKKNQLKEILKKHQLVNGVAIWDLTEKFLINHWKKIFS